jgi:biotin carboxyl carrier protein
MEWQISETAPGELLLEAEGKRTRAFVADVGATRWVFVDGHIWEVEAPRPGSNRASQPGSAEALRQSSGQALRQRAAQTLRQSSGPAAGAASTLAAPMPATVLRILAKPGTAVRKGETLILLEAMKMELPLRAPQDGTVTALRCKEGELVQAGAVLIELA